MGTTTQQWLLIIIGLAVSAGLVVYIRSRARTLKNRKHERQQQDARRGSRRQDAVQSVRVLAMTIEQDQVVLTEACIRIHGLLQVIAPDLLEQKPYSIFRLMAEETAHMPTHEARNETDKRFVRRMDQQRLNLEDKHREENREAASAIRQYPFEAS